MKYKILIVVIVMFVSAVFAGERAITPGDRALTQSVPCNGKVEGPVYIQALFKGASIPQYVCYHSINNDALFEVALIYVYNSNDSTFELVRAMRINEYWDMVENERSMQE